MSFHVFQNPSLMLTGPGSFAELGKVSAAMGKHALVLAGAKAMKEQGYTEKTRGMLHQAGMQTTMFDGLGMEPTVQMVDQGRKVFKAAEADMVVALGAGSVIDAGKLIAALVNEEEDTRHFVDGHALQGNGVRVVAVPTAPGSGAEVGCSAEIHDMPRRLKKTIQHEKMMPKAAIIDPDLMVQCPQPVIAASGADGVCHAIESYLSIHANPMTAGLAINALKLYVEYLPKYFNDPKDADARMKCAYAATQAGMAAANTKLGFVHGVAHAIGGKYKIPHGAVTGILLPYILRYNKEECPEKYEDLGHAVGGGIIKYTEKLKKFLKMPTTLAHLKMDEDTMNDIAIQTMLSDHTRANPREVTREAVKTLLDAVSKS